MLPGRPAKILLIDTNVYFSKRLSDALKREGFEVNCSTQPAFALTTLEYDAPSAIVCSTNMREMGALDIARMIRADTKNSAMPIIALGDGSQRALMEAFQAGCDDYIDRTRPPAVIATHVKNIIVSKAEGFQPTQMLAQSDTSLSGSLTHHDLPGVMQMLGHAHQTGALHINSGDTDALLFFDAGAISHAECGSLFGDEAVIHILKSCFQNSSGVYKFVYGSASTQRTVLRSATDLMLDAMREVDESSRDSESADEPEFTGPPDEAAILQAEKNVERTPSSSKSLAVTAETADGPGVAAEQDFCPAMPQTIALTTFCQSNFSGVMHTPDDQAVACGEEQFARRQQADSAIGTHTDDSSAISNALDGFASNHSNNCSAASTTADSSDFAASLDNAGEPYNFHQNSETPAHDESASAPQAEHSESSATDPEEVL
jgi:CheY-like chemotaxis protein